jgi:hypothetical protein
MKEPDDLLGDRLVISKLVSLKEPFERWSHFFLLGFCAVASEA